MEKRIAFVIGSIFTLILFTACQKRPSPAASATCDLGADKIINTNYSSPRMNGRMIYGDLVPFGQVWRAGANEATTFVTSSDLVVGGNTVPFGSYTIFTIPAADKWTLIISKKTGEWGMPTLLVPGMPSPRVSLITTCADIHLRKSVNPQIALHRGLRRRQALPRPSA